MKSRTHTPPTAAGGDQPRLAAGIELLGEFKDSGFKEAPYLVRRGDGQVIQLPRLLYLVAEAADGRRDYGEVAEWVTERARRRLDADGVQLLVEEKLRPLGVFVQPDGSTPELAKADPLLALKAKTAVVPTGLVGAIARVFRPLFLPPVVVGFLAAFFALDAWLFVHHGVAQSLRQALYDPLFILLLLGLVVLSAAFHECGHATACSYGGAKPGAMGIGIYIVWPAFYTDVTDAYRLGKGGRLRTDLGGVYFNAIFTVATFGVYFLTGWEPLLLVVPLQIMEILHQFLPFIRLDGYYIVADLTGVPDMFSRIKPTLKSLSPLAEAPPEVTHLKPWVRTAVTAYVCTVVPLLLFLLGLTVMNVPRIVATAWDSLLHQNSNLHQHVAGGQYVRVVVDAIQMAVLLLPVAGLYVTLRKVAQTIVDGAWARTEGRRLARVLLVAGTGAAAAFAAYIWLPNGDYRPIQAAERGTIVGGLDEVRAIPWGRPSLTARRAQELDGAPWRTWSAGLAGSNPRTKDSGRGVVPATTTSPSAKPARDGSGERGTAGVTSTGTDTGPAAGSGTQTEESSTTLSQTPGAGATTTGESPSNAQPPAPASTTTTPPAPEPTSPATTTTGAPPSTTEQTTTTEPPPPTQP